MIRFRRPSPVEIDAHLSISDRSFSYPEVGSTAIPTSLESIGVHYDLDRHRFPLGVGRDLFERAQTSLLAWRHFEIPWLELHGVKAKLSSGQVVATLAHFSGLWFLNPCRVVYTERASDSSNETAFAYGTLSGHVERGEERFSVNFNPTTGDVTYEILAFSRPAVLLSKIGYFWARRLQNRFALSSFEALVRACRLGASLESDNT